jgi:hypothetical protein
MEVDWSKLIACRGSASAEGVPKAIDLLFDGPPEDRRRAYFGIDNYVVVQGALYESAPYAARHVVERLKAEPEKLNLEILDILFELVNGRTVPVRDRDISPDRVVENGPLKGRSIEQLCLDTVREVLPQLREIRPTLDKPEQDTIQDLLEVCEQRDLERRCRSQEPEV